MHPDFLKAFVGFSLRSVLSSWPRDWRLPTVMIPGCWDGFSVSVAVRPTRARARARPNQSGPVALRTRSRGDRKRSSSRDGLSACAGSDDLKL